MTYMVTQGADNADLMTIYHNGLYFESAAIRLSRATLRNIYENLFWAFAYNAVLIPMAAGVYPGIQMNPMWGAAAMALSSFTVCMNALRLNLFNVHSEKHDYAIKKAVDDIMNEETTDMEKTVKIEGMMCAHCEKHVKDAIEKHEGVDAAIVSHESGTAVLSVNDKFLAEQVEAEVRDAGYEFGGIIDWTGEIEK